MAQFALPIGCRELAAMDLAKGRPLSWCDFRIHYYPLQLKLLDRVPIAGFRTGRPVSDVEKFLLVISSPLSP